MKKPVVFICVFLAVCAGVAVAVDYIVVDDFDSYADTAALKAVWNDSTNGASGDGIVKLNTDPNFAVDGNSMQLEYWNDTNPYYSETTRSYATGQDWSYATAGVTALELEFFGDVNNGPDPPMYVKLSDDTNTAQVNHDDGNSIKEEFKHTWVMPLAAFTNVNLSNIKSITLGIGDLVGEVGAPNEIGTIYFDDIRLYPPRCFPEYGPATDFTDDCNVDMNDLFTVVEDWSKSGHWAYPAIPETNGVIQYTFDEGSGTVVHNSGTWGDANGYDLTIGMSWDSNGDPVMEPNNDPCWVNDPCRGWCLFFDGELGLHPNNPGYNGGDYLVIPPLNLNSDTVSITAWIKPDGWLLDAKKGIYGQKGDRTGLVFSHYSGILIDGTLVYLGDSSLMYIWGACISCRASIDYLPDWQWSFIAVVKEAEGATLYLADFNNPADPNDDMLLTSSGLAYQTDFGDVRTLIAGAEVYNDGFFRGYMDDVRIYDVSLTEDEIIGLAGMDGAEYIPLDSEADFCVGRKDPCDPCSPVNDQIDLCDFSRFADEWLETKLWPEP